MKVLVCGGRYFHNVPYIRKVLDTVHAQRPITLLIHGAARGVDSLAGAWGKGKGVRVAEFPAEWKRFGAQAAGAIRNGRMMAEGQPDLVVAFPGGNGTRDMVHRARLAGKPLLDCREAFDELLLAEILEFDLTEETQNGNESVS